MSITNDTLHDTASTDAELVASCATVIDIPKASAPDSFVLHAPLELLARALLLDYVSDGGRPLPRARLQWLAEKYEAAGPSADPVPLPTSIDVDELLVSLAAAGH